MGKKNSEKCLGRAIIKDRFGSKRKSTKDFSHLHNAELQDGYDWGTLNLQSVTEESSFQEFFATAELAETEFAAEKLNIQFINLNSQIGVLSKEKHKEIIQLQEKNKNLLKIPRRPKWDKSTTAQEMDKNEKEQFLEWRKNMAVLSETEGLILTPFEKNLEFWRQLWRVIERSNIIVQIVDARNPLLFRCEDLERYVKEVDQNKLNMILINKADFLTDQQRKTWADYFSKINVHVAFFSAILASEEKETTNPEEETETTNPEVEKETANPEVEKETTNPEVEKETTNPEVEKETTNPEVEKESSQESANEEVNDKVVNAMNNLEVSKNESNAESEDLNENQVKNTSDLLTREELISLFKKIHPSQRDKNEKMTVGFVGYPNVGKSSTINALIMTKKVSVSKTPGKTKHFQTIHFDEHLILCDCPGLVMPSFVATKSEMILNGILPVNQLKDHVPPVNLLGSLIPKSILENQYGIMIPLPPEGEDPDRAPISEEILNAHALNRGFMTQNGQPDNSRSARYILKDFIDGKLLYCVAPPGYDQKEFHIFSVYKKKKLLTASSDTQKVMKPIKATTEDIDKKFFQNKFSNVHVKGNRICISQENKDFPSTSDVSSSIYIEEKPWKKRKALEKRKKHDKLRRTYAYLDKH